MSVWLWGNYKLLFDSRPAVLLMSCYFSIIFILHCLHSEKDTFRVNVWTCVLLTSRLMILRAVRCILGVSACMWTRSICDKLCKPEGDKQLWPSPAYSWTSKDRHWTDSSHTSWFSVGSCRETHSVNAYMEQSMTGLKISSNKIRWYKCLNIKH